MFGSSDSRHLRPPPDQRCQVGGGELRSSSSRIPVQIVRSDIPVAAATASMPPQPSDRASTAALSSSALIQVPDNRGILLRIHSTTCVFGILGNIIQPAVVRQYQFRNLLLSSAKVSSLAGNSLVERLTIVCAISSKAN